MMSNPASAFLAGTSAGVMNRVNNARVGSGSSMGARGGQGAAIAAVAGDGGKPPSHYLPNASQVPEGYVGLGFRGPNGELVPFASPVLGQGRYVPSLSLSLSPVLFTPILSLSALFLSLCPSPAIFPPIYLSIHLNLSFHPRTGDLGLHTSPP